jgi:hypothetical protein
MEVKSLEHIKNTLISALQVLLPATFVIGTGNNKQRSALIYVR